MDLAFSGSLPSESSVIEAIMNANTSFVITNSSGKTQGEKMSFKPSSSSHSGYVAHLYLELIVYVLIF